MDIIRSNAVVGGRCQEQFSIIFCKEYYMRILSASAIHGGAIHSKNERCFEEPKRVLQLVPNREPFLVLRRTLLEGSLEEPYHMVLWRTLGFFTDICSGFFREPFEGSPGNLIASTHQNPMVLQGTPKTYKGSWRNLVI